MSVMSIRKGTVSTRQLTPAEAAQRTADEQKWAQRMADRQAKEYLRSRLKDIREEFTDLKNFDELVFKGLDIIVDEIIAIRQGNPVTARFTAMANKLDQIKQRHPQA